MPGAGGPIKIPFALWQHPHMLYALGARDIGQVFRMVRQYSGASQSRLAIACGMTQGKVSEIMKVGGRQVSALEVFERIADGLGMPDHARMALGLAPTEPGAVYSPEPVRTGVDPPVESGPALPLIMNEGPRRWPNILAESTMAAWPGRRRSDGRDGDGHADRDDHTGGDHYRGTGGRGRTGVGRRHALSRSAEAGLFASILAERPGPQAAVGSTETFAAALVGRPAPTGANASADSDAGEVRVDLDQLTTRVAQAKRNYHGCLYSDVISDLPNLLADLHIAARSLAGDDRLTVQALSAEGHHVAASILLKLDDRGLAWVAADRSMQSARASQDPVAIGCSARIVTHALMSDRHYGAATSTATEFAERLDRDIGEHTPDSLSVYGALLLRGAVAAARHGDRDTAATLLDEARHAADRLGGDHNHRWTAFGPTNVRLHRISIALLLGDAGTAIREAGTIGLAEIGVTERKAALLIDTARALAQWGKHHKAYEVLRMAHRLAPEEISARPAVHRLLRDLTATATPPVERQIRKFTAQIGVHP